MRFYLLVSCVFAGLFSCSNLTVNDDSVSVNTAVEGFGSLSVSGSQDSSRALAVSDISIVKVEVSGTGISETLAGSGSIVSGNGSVTVEKIPVGVNRVVTVYAYDSSEQKLGRVMLRAITDIKSGSNSITVDKSTTALANVYAELLAAGADLSKVSSSKISAVIDSSKSWALIDAETIAADYLKNQLQSASNYILETGTVSILNNDSSVKVQVGDPVSSIATVPSGTSTIENVAPGTWPVYVTKADGTIEKTFITVTSGKTTSITLGEITDRIIVHVSTSAGYQNIYAWISESEKLFGDWPGSAMTDSDGDGWYDVTIGKTSTNLIFNGSNGQTADLSREAGEWWYKGGAWYSANPDDSVAPVLSSFAADKNGTVSGEVILTASASDDKSLSRIVFILDGSSQILSKSVSGTSGSAEYTWNTALIKNGTHVITALAYDAAGNISNEMSLTFTTSNENLPPVAVISGPSISATSSERTFSASASYDQNGGTIASYTWTVSGATVKSGAGTSVITVKMPDNETSVEITLRVTDDEGAASETVSKSIKIVKQDANWDFRDESIYFVMTTRFYDGDSSNNEYCWDEGGENLKFGDDINDCAWRGDFKGLAQKLDYIKALGFSAIWITPVVQNASGIDYHGYHAYDFSKVDPRYESAGYTYQDFINDCHAKGIKVIQDIVLNHTGNFGEKNLFHMFDKDTTPYVNKDVATPTSIPRSPFMHIATDGNAYSKLMAGMSMRGVSDYDTAEGGAQYDSRINAMKEDSIDTDFIYHHEKQIDWNSEKCQLGQMAGDCVDLNTENPTVFKYLTDCYNSYIDMGVDAFRIDTVKHISRYTFNKEFIPAFMERGGEKFFIFGETCARYRGRWNEGVPALSPAFYTWKETVDLPWSQTDSSVNSASATQHFSTYCGSFDHPAWASGIANHLLNGNDYHTPDWSMRSYLDQIDFPMHWAFNSAKDAFDTAVGTNDPDFNDATWNVTYVDSHDYAPDNAPESQRFTGYWPDKLNLIFTFRGIPCIYYGSEIEFKKGCAIDPANTRTSLENSGRAYFGDYLEGSVTASDYGVYTASGTVANTLNHELAQHVRRLNLIRRSITALRKGQYSTQGCSGSIAFKRRYTDSNVDSFALVAINGQATFSGIPSGTYIEVITGKTVSSSGSLTSDSIGEGNMRVYVLQTSSCEVSGKIGEDGAYLN